MVGWLKILKNTFVHKSINTVHGSSALGIETEQHNNWY